MERATQSMYVRFSCGHYMHPQPGDQVMPACPVCYPPKGHPPWILPKTPKVEWKDWNDAA